MIVAIGALAVTSLLIAAVFVAVNGDVHQTRHDLDAKRAYYAARAGLNAYMYQLNQNPDYWDTCSNNTMGMTAVPGAGTGVRYSYQPVYNAGYTSTSCQTNVIPALIDQASGTLRIEFTGYSGTPTVTRTIVASFRKRSPMDFLWYTVYETQDPWTKATCGGSQGKNGTGKWYRQGASSGCYIYWAADTVNGPMYTQDQLMINGSSAPTFGRNKNDQIESEGPTLCSGGCGNANVKGTVVAPVPSDEQVSLPTDNSQLYTDAQNHGQTYTGTTNITLNGTTANITVCPSASTCQSKPPVDLTANKLIYVSNGSGCNPDYDPTYVNYAQRSDGNYYGPCGDIYVSGSYSTPLTLAAGNDIVLDGSVTTNLNGTATLGLVATEFVRVMHGAAGWTYNSRTGDYACTGDDLTHTLKNPVIDAAILTLGHSFFVDNFDCGSPSTMGSLYVNGAMAQKYRGAVGTGGTPPSTGYKKAYSYDDRLHVLLPPYLFDIATSDWEASRETLCTPSTSTTDSASCAYTGT